MQVSQQSYVLLEETIGTIYKKGVNMFWCFIGGCILGILLVPIVIGIFFLFGDDTECPMFLRQKEQDKRDDYTSDEKEFWDNL